jgi:hypothetical protein
MRIRRVAALVVVVVALASLATRAPAAGADGVRRDEARNKALVRAVDKNVGHMHMTRGMNACTILALHDAASRPDIPVLQRMLDDKDRVVSLTVLKVLPTFGAAGVAALRTRAAGLDRLDLEAAIDGAAKTIETMDGYRSRGDCRLRR